MLSPWCGFLWHSGASISPYPLKSINIERRLGNCSQDSETDWRVMWIQTAGPVWVQPSLSQSHYWWPYLWNNRSNCSVWISLPKTCSLFPVVEKELQASGIFPTVSLQSIEDDTLLPSCPRSAAARHSTTGFSAADKTEILAVHTVWLSCTLHSDPKPKWSGSRLHERRLTASLLTGCVTFRCSACSSGLHSSFSSELMFLFLPNDD